MARIDSISGRQQDSIEAPEMRLFARSTFLLCRQCGFGRLDKESINISDLLRRGPLHKLSPSVTPFFYGLVAHLVWLRRGANLPIFFLALTHSNHFESFIDWLSIISRTQDNMRLALILLSKTSLASKTVQDPATTLPDQCLTFDNYELCLQVVSLVHAK